MVMKNEIESQLVSLREELNTLETQVQGQVKGAYFCERICQEHCRQPLFGFGFIRSHLDY